MSDHLPECGYLPDCECWKDGSGLHSCGTESCICDRLRACEARVTERWEALRGCGESFAYKTGSDNGFDVGYEAALDAAREEVLNAPRYGCTESAEPLMELREVLCAIDALRGESE